MIKDGLRVIGRERFPVWSFRGYRRLCDGCVNIRCDFRIDDRILKPGTGVLGPAAASEVRNFSCLSAAIQAQCLCLVVDTWVLSCRVAIHPSLDVFGQTRHLACVPRNSISDSGTPRSVKCFMRRCGKVHTIVVDFVFWTPHSRVSRAGGRVRGRVVVEHERGKSIAIPVRIVVGPSRAISDIGPVPTFEWLPCQTELKQVCYYI